MSDLINREELLKLSHTVVVKDMWHMNQEIEVVNVEDIKKLQPQEKPLVIIRYSDKCENCSEILNNLVNERLEHMWIPLSERLPEAYQECLFTVEAHHWENEPIRYQVVQKAYGGETNFIAWMPLPKPYKGDEK